MSTQKEDFERKSAYLAETKELLEDYVSEAGGNASGTFRETVEEAGKLMHELDLQPLTFTGAVNVTYDGKTAVTVNIPSGGDSNELDKKLIDFTTTEEVSKILIPLTGIADKINNAENIKFRIVINSKPTSEEVTKSGTITASFQRSWTMATLFKAAIMPPYANAYQIPSRGYSETRRFIGAPNLPISVQTYRLENTNLPTPTLFIPYTSKENLVDADNLVISSTTVIGIGTQIQLWVKGVL